EAELRRVVELAPKKFEHRAALAAFFVRGGAPDKAEAALREARNAAPDEERRAFALIDYLAATKGFDAAEKELRAQIAERPKGLELRFGLANLLVSARREDEAALVYRQIVAADASGPKGLQARGALARLLLAQGKAEEADALVAAVLKENPRDNAALLLRA